MSSLKNNLSLINCGLKSLEEVGVQKNLIGCNLHSNRINKITGLHICFNLKYLDLSSNDLVKIEGLEFLTNLVTLNLSGNKIKVVENISNLTSLVVCNLSFNNIERLDGFKQLSGPNYKLEVLDLRGNLINSIEHLISSLKPCRSLRHLLLLTKQNLKPDSSRLSFSSTEDELEPVSERMVWESNNGEKCVDENPIGYLPNYRYTILKALVSLVSLDHLDRKGQYFKVESLIRNVNFLPEVQEFKGYFTTSESSELDKFVSNVFQSNPPHVETKDKKIGTAGNGFVTVPDPSKQPIPLKSDLTTEQVEKDTLHPEQVAKDTLRPEETFKQCLENLGEKFLKILDEKLNKNKAEDISTIKIPSKIPILKSGYKEQLVRKGKENLRKLGNNNHLIQLQTGRTARPFKQQQQQHRQLDSDYCDSCDDGDSESRNKYTCDGGDIDVAVKGNSGRAAKSKALPSSSYKHRSRVSAKSSSSATVAVETVAANFSRLMENLDKEKELRWKAEKSVAELSRRLREEIEEKSNLLKKVKEGHERGEKDQVVIDPDVARRLKNDLEIEVSKNTELSGRLENLEQTCSDFKKKSVDLEVAKNQIEVKLKVEEENWARSEKERSEIERSLKAKGHENQIKLMAMKKELEILKGQCEHQKGKISELQALLILKENEMQGRATKDSKELHDYTEAKIETVKNPLLLKISQLERSYVDLEDEFREALRSETLRYEKVKDAFVCSEETLKECRMENEEMKEKLQKNLSLMAELNAIVKGQKGRLSELSTAKHEQTRELKSRVRRLEKELKDRTNDLEELTRLSQERSVLRARVESLESLILGLKSEKRLWGEELAQQSSSLAQEKGRLESKLESVQLEVGNLHKQLTDELQQSKVKSKVIDDQLDSIRKLKSNLAGKDEQIKANEMELRETEAEAETRLATAVQERAELAEKLERCSAKREELKERLKLAEEVADASGSECKRMKEEWRRMKEEIKAVEKKVVGVAETRAANERLVEEAKQSLIRRHEKEIQEIQHGHRKQLVAMEADAQVRVKMGEERMKGVEEEMRDLLEEREKERGEGEEKMTRLARLLREFAGSVT